MVKVKINPVRCKRILHRINVWFLPFRWTLNPYRGCQFNCIYCNARYTHEYLGLGTDDFQHEIFAKINAAERLDAEFSRRSWRGSLVHIGAVTDPYQPAENKFLIMRGILEVVMEHGNPIDIATKSNLILRDLDLIREISEKTFLNVTITVTTTEPVLARKLEPNAPSTEERLRVVKTLSQSGVNVGVTLIPIIPYLTDKPDQIEGVVETSMNAGANYVIAGGLNLKKSARPKFTSFLQESFPELVSKYDELYKEDYLPKTYRKRLRAEFQKILKKHGADNYYGRIAPTKEFWENRQKKERLGSKSTR